MVPASCAIKSRQCQSDWVIETKNSLLTNISKFAIILMINDNYYVINNKRRYSHVKIDKLTVRPFCKSHP
jgi:hypothetical protein